MARREELWTVKVGKRIAKLKRTREQIAGLAALAEHARAVRIVKKKIRSLEACIASDKRDGNEAGAMLHVYALSILNSTLADMQKGRA
ncbi:MAG: hypothetical protein GDA68_18730 [Nitrospira sp. CR2.1]|jgi:hypothetical protein|nr:hypothetical protein [Nitrospira sp. CR2.1]MBA5875222.1 hypothetical protein [Nitrospira sp. CR1.2]